MRYRVIPRFKSGRAHLPTSSPARRVIRKVAEDLVERMTARQVHVTLPVDEKRVHLFQVVREHRHDDSTEDWVVVDFPPEGIRLASLDFEWHRTVPLSAVADGTVEPLVEGSVPVWGY